METATLMQFLDRFGVFEGFLVIALWLCLKEIRGLYLRLIAEKDQAIADLQKVVSRGTASRPGGASIDRQQG